MKKKISILGSTGSVGQNTLEVIACHPDQFEVVGLAAGTQIEKLSLQIQKFRPKAVSVAQASDAKLLKEKFPQIEFFQGESGLIEIATLSESDFVVSSLVGAVGIRPTYEAIRAKKQVALANKEVLVAAGSIIQKVAFENNVRLLPIDSEHSAIFQVLSLSSRAESEGSPPKITLTASGGPFLNTPKEDFPKITVGQALNHPTWKMGGRITIDSATLMNKGFEVIEAHWLFGVKPSQIEVVVHPQSIIHGMVTYPDGNTLACLSIPDMKAPIAYALSYPKRIRTEVPSLDLTKIQNLSFQKPDLTKFPLLKLAFQTLASQGLWSTVLNAADEIAVEAFLKEKIGFHQISEIVEKTLNAYPNTFGESLEDVFEADRWARNSARQVINMLS